MNVWPKKWTLKGKRNGGKFRLHQRIPREGNKWGYDCYTPSMFNTREDAELFSKEFEESLKDAIHSGIKDVDEHPWTEIFVKKVKQFTRKPGYLSKWITDDEGVSGTGAKRTASKQSSGGQKVDAKEAVPQAVGNDDASKKQRHSSRRGGNNGGNLLEWSFTLRERDKAAHVREVGKQELAISSTNEAFQIPRYSLSAVVFSWSATRIHLLVQYLLVRYLLI